MSISEIVNYVNRTPHNTNPNVIASMVQGANEQAVYESVEELKQDGGVGYIEPAKVILDVDLAVQEEGIIPSATGWIGEEMSLPFEEGKTYEVISNRGSCTSVCARDGSNLFIYGYFESDEPNDFGMTFMVVSEYDEVNDYRRVLVADLYGATHITIKTAETVHTIEPKYLPKGGVGYTEGSKTEILPEQTVPVNEELGGYVLEFAPVAGKVYTVTVDGVEYKCEAKLSISQGSELVVLGNAIMYGEPGNGEPWYIAYVFDYQLCAFGWTNGSDTDPTIAIYEGEETVHTIDPKYLPEMTGGGLPHVDVSFMKQPSNLVGDHCLTKESSDKIGELAKAGVLAFTARFVNSGPGAADAVFLFCTESMTTDMDNVPYPWYVSYKMWSNGTFAYVRFDRDIFDLEGYGTDRWTVNYKKFTFTTA